MSRLSWPAPWTDRARGAGPFTTSTSSKRRQTELTPCREHNERGDFRSGRVRISSFGPFVRIESNCMPCNATAECARRPAGELWRTYTAMSQSKLQVVPVKRHRGAGTHTELTLPITISAVPCLPSGSCIVYSSELCTGTCCVYTGKKTPGGAGTHSVYTGNMNSYWKNGA
jgi:hypothetical protein